MRILVSHVTRLDYEAEVSESVMETRLGPRDDSDQQTRRFQLRIEPVGHVRRYEDGFGNVGHLLTAMRPHTYFQVVAESEVQTALVDPFEVPNSFQPLDPVDRVDYLFPSPLVPAVASIRDLAGPARPADAAATFEAVRRLSSLVYERFDYRQNVTDVTTSIDDVLSGGQGVCQDFAHVLIGLCRSIDIPARYVSGYIVAHNGAPSDASQSPSRGAGASHAWVEAFTPTHGWRGFDPTNDLVANASYVKVAVGRDYQDVAPTRGTYHGAADERLTVAVTTRALDQS